MRLETSIKEELLVAKFTFVRGIKMCFPVLTKFGRSVKFLLTQFAFKCGIRMSFPMLTKVARMSECFRASVTFVWLCTCMRIQMALKHPFGFKLLAAGITSKKRIGVRGAGIVEEKSAFVI